MSFTEAEKKWKEKNTVMVVMRLQKSTDADLIEAINSAKSKQGEIKRLMRIGLACEKENSPD